MALLLALLACVGCTPQEPVALEAQAGYSAPRAANPTGSIVDIGVVFAQRGGQFVFPYSEFGLNDSDEVLSIDSSCECVHARPVQYASGKGRQSPAIEITVESDSVPASAPQRLRVVLQFSLASGEAREGKVDFLNTNPVTQQETDS